MPCWHFLTFQCLSAGKTYLCGSVVMGTSASWWWGPCRLHLSALHDDGVSPGCSYLPFMMMGPLQVVPLCPSCWWGPSRLHLSALQQTDTILVDFPLAPLGPYVHNLHRKCGITHHTHKVFTNLHSHQPRVRNPPFLRSALIGISRPWSFCQSEGAKWCLLLICISWTVNEFEHRSECSLAFGVSFSVNCLSRRLPVFLLDPMSSPHPFAEFLLHSRCESLVSFFFIYFLRKKKSYPYHLTLNWPVLFLC